MKIVIMEPLGITAEKVEEAAKAVKQKGHEVIYYETRTENTAELIERGKDADIIIVDEVSMVDSFLMNYITKAIYLGSKLVLVGDSNQLPSVGPRLYFKRLNWIRTICNCTFK